jgi:hypothetical protein
MFVAKQYCMYYFITVYYIAAPFWLSCNLRVTVLLTCALPALVYNSSSIPRVAVSHARKCVGDLMSLCSACSYYSYSMLTLALCISMQLLNSSMCTLELQSWCISSAKVIKALRDTDCYLCFFAFSMVVVVDAKRLLRSSLPIR